MGNFASGTLTGTQTESQTKGITITLGSTIIKHGSELNFADDIRSTLQATRFNQRTCQSCHFSDSNVKGIPVY